MLCTQRIWCHHQSPPGRPSAWRQQWLLNGEDCRFQARIRHSDLQTRFCKTPSREKSQQSRPNASEKRSSLHRSWSYHITLATACRHLD